MWWNVFWSRYRFRKKSYLCGVYDPKSADELTQPRHCTSHGVQLGGVSQHSTVFESGSLPAGQYPCHQSFKYVHNGTIHLLKTNKESIKLKNWWDPAFHSFTLLWASSLGLTYLGHLQFPQLPVLSSNEGFVNRNKISTSKKISPFCGSHKSEFLRPVASFCKGLVGDLRVKQPILAFIR